jgi:transcriptional regulator with XRE-family HTH domain
MIGDTIRELREARAWTQAHLADAAGLSLRTVQRLESLHSCSHETLLSLAAALEVDVRNLTEERMPKRTWRGPSPRIAALFGALLALPAIVFVVVNLLKYGLGVDGPYDALASAGEKADGTVFFDTPWLLLGGPVIALLLNLFTLVRPRIRRDGPGAALVAIDLRFNLASLAVILLAGAALALLSAHLAADIVHKIALGATL